MLFRHVRGIGFDNRQGAPRGCHEEGDQHCEFASDAADRPLLCKGIRVMLVTICRLNGN
jgi:hypothetical protein